MSDRGNNTGGEGFYHLRYKDVPILPAILRTEGYDVSILGKVPHSSQSGRSWQAMKEAAASDPALVAPCGRHWMI